MCSPGNAFIVLPQCLYRSRQFALDAHKCKNTVQSTGLHRLRARFVAPLQRNNIMYFPYVTHRE